MTQRISDLVGSLRKWMKREAQAGLLSFHLGLEPAPASRPKVGRFGVYYGKKYERFRKAALPLAEGADLPHPPIDGPVVMMMENVVTPPKKGKYPYPKSNGDVDNFAKGPLDAFTKSGNWWGDDDQVVGLMVWKRYAQDGEEPGVYIDYFPLEEKE